MSGFLAFSLSIGLGVTHWKWGSKQVGFTGYAWQMVGLPLALSAWLVLPVTGWTWGLAVAWVVGFFFVGVGGKFGFFKPSGRAGGEVVRGTEIITDKQAEAWLKQSGELVDCAAKIGEVPIPEAVETTHFLMAGAPGSGKSLAFRQLLNSARKRGHRAIVADLGGEFVKHYYRPGKDLILNPFDKRTKHWSPFAEMRQSMDAARIAASMIPEGIGESKEWNGYARAVLEGILERCYETDQATNQALVYYALGANTKELAELCANTPAGIYFVEGNERQLGSIRGILASYIKPLTYLRPEAGRDSFSVRAWIENDGDTWLFVTYRKDQLDALRAMLAAQIDTACVTILSMESELSRRLWFSLDEFAQLGEIRQLEPLLNLGRKHGVCGILGMQGMTQPAMVFGRERAQAILAGLGTWTVFRQADAESADYMSRFLGDEEIRRQVSSNSTNKDSTSSTTSEQILRQRAIMPGELMQMAVRRGIVNVAGPLPPAWTSIPLPAEPQPEAVRVVGIEEMPNTRAMLVQKPKTPPPTLEAPAQPEPPKLSGLGGAANRFEV